MAGNAGKEYKAKYRSLIFNLRDDANPDLRRRVLTGDIPPDKLVTFSHNELASKVEIYFRSCNLDCQNWLSFSHCFLILLEHLPAQSGLFESAYTCILLRAYGRLCSASFIPLTPALMQS